jgi:hypothetical protein
MAVAVRPLLVKQKDFKVLFDKTNSSSLKET